MFVGRARARAEHVVALAAHLARAIDLRVNRIAETNNAIGGVYVKSTSVSGTNTDGGANPNANDILFDTPFLV